MWPLRTGLPGVAVPFIAGVFDAVFAPRFFAADVAAVFAADFLVVAFLVEEVLAAAHPVADLRVVERFADAAAFFVAALAVVLFPAAAFFAVLFLVAVFFVVAFFVAVFFVAAFAALLRPRPVEAFPAVLPVAPAPAFSADASARSTCFSRCSKRRRMSASSSALSRLRRLARPLSPRLLPVRAREARACFCTRS